MDDKLKNLSNLVKDEAIRIHRNEDRGGYAERKPVRAGYYAKEVVEEYTGMKYDDVLEKETKKYEPPEAEPITPFMRKESTKSTVSLVLSALGLLLTVFGILLTILLI